MIGFRRSWPTRRAQYFQHLLTLQAELIKLPDWVQHTKAKIVVVCEGRDAAGKGGVITHHAAVEPTRLPRRRAPRPDRARKDSMVFPALHIPSAGRWRNRAVRPLLV